MGICYNRLAEAVLTSTHNLCFEQKYEKYQSFLSENFQFFGGEISKNLNRRVFCNNFNLFISSISGRELLDRTWYKVLMICICVAT